jgi:hypothetical protein
MDRGREEQADSGPLREDAHRTTRVPADGAGLRPEHSRILLLQEQAGNRAVGALLDSAADVEIPAGGGAALPDTQRTAFEQAMGQPLDHVRIHRGASADSAARSLGAQAFTVGSDVYFANGSYAPGTADGDRRLGHELTHVAQHDAGRVPPASASDSMVSSPTDPLEREAYGREGAVAAALRSDVEPAPIAGRAATRAPAAVLRAADTAAPAQPAEQQQSAGPSDEQLLPVPEQAPPLPAPAGQAPPPPAAPAAPAPPAPPPLPATAPVAPPAPAAVAAPPGPPPVWVSLPEGGVPAAPDLAGLAEAGPISGEAQAHLQAIAAQAQASTDRITTEVARLTGEARAAATQARAELAAAHAAQVQALDARGATALAAISAARDAQLSTLAAAGEAERLRLADAHQAAAAGATAHVATLRQETLAAGAAEAARAQSASEARATAILGRGEGVAVTGEEPSAEAQRESARRIARRAADQCRATGAQVADRVRQEAAHHAGGNYDGMLRDHLSKLDEARAAAEPMIGELSRQAATAIDQKAVAAGQALRVLAGQAAVALDRERARALTTVDAWEAQATTALAQAGARATQAMAAELASVSEAFLAEGDLTPARDLVVSGVAQAGESTVSGLAALYADLLGELTGWTSQSGSAVTDAGVRLQQGLTSGADGATEDIRVTAASFQQRLAAGVTEGVGRITGADQEFRAGTTGIHQDALTALARAVDEGLAREDELLGRADAELSTVTGRVAAQYTNTQNQARQQQVPGAQVMRGIWGRITGWVSDLHASAKRWFADVFGEWLGGLLLGILTGLIIVAAGWLIAVAVGAIVAVFIKTALIATLVTIGILLVAGVSLAIYNRFQEFYADNPGQDAGILRGLALVGLGVADLTGIPFIVEGVVGQRAFGAEMSTFDSMERLGMGIVFLGAVLVSAKNLLRGKPKPDERPPARNLPEQGTETGAKPAAGRAGFKEGVYDAADPKATPNDWKFTDTVTEPTADSPLRIAETQFEAPNGAKGMGRRAVNTETGALELQEINVPPEAKWIPTEPPLVEGKGTPTAAYVSMRLMQKLGVAAGTLRTVMIKNIWNLRAILELRKLELDGVARDQAVARTNSVTSQETALTQSGHRISGARVKPGTGKSETLREVLEYWETKQETLKEPDPAIVKQHDKILDEFGLTREQANSEPFFWDYDIEVFVEPAPGGGTQ